MLDNLQPGQILLADRAYDSNALREAMTGQRAVGEHRADGPQTGPARVQPLPVSLQEPGRALLQQAQALPRDRHPHEKHATNYLALVKLAAIRIWLRHNKSVS